MIYQLAKSIIATALVILAVFFLYPTTTFALWGGPNGYGWGKLTITSGSQNTYIYVVHDADTGELVVPDRLTVDLVNATLGLIRHYECNGNCSATTTITGIPSNILIDHYGGITKSGYNYADAPGHWPSRITYDGSKVTQTDAYITKTGTMPQAEYMGPQPLWYSYLPTPKVKINPRPGASSVWVRWIFHDFFGYPPFPTEVNLSFDQPPSFPASSVTDGWYGVGAASGDNLGYDYSRYRGSLGIDRTPPAITCTMSHTSGTSSIPISIKVTDPSSGVSKGLVEVSVNGGGWSTVGIPGSGDPITNPSPANIHDITSNFTFTATEGRSYRFRVRAMDNAFDINGLTTQWSTFTNCLDGASDIITIPLPSPTVDIKANNSDTSIEVDYGSTINLTWTTQHSTSCTPSVNWNNASYIPSGSKLVGPLTGPATNLYSLTCTNGVESVTDSVEVKVKEGYEAWLKTSGGDVHSNNKVLTPGGP